MGRRDEDEDRLLWLVLESGHATPMDTLGSRFHGHAFHDVLLRLVDQGVLLLDDKSRTVRLSQSDRCDARILTSFRRYYGSDMTPYHAQIVKIGWDPERFHKAMAMIKQREAISSATSVLRILVIATEWEPHHGGLSTFNRELCRALAAAGHRVICLVPVSTREDMADARRHGVTLVEASRAEGKDVGVLAGLLRRPRLPDDFLPDVVIGHGRITGFAARTQVTDSFPRALRVHFLHTMPSEIEWYKSRAKNAASRAEGSEEQETELARTAALAVGVGPRLKAKLDYLLHPFEGAPPVHEFIPGLGDDDVDRRPPPGRDCLFLGRAEDDKLKGLDIAASSVAVLRKRNVESVLVIRGAPAGGGEALQRRLKKTLPWPNAIRVKEFTTNGDRIQVDLLRSSVVLMPSRSEGFGLVGLEAIALGIPTLVTDQSGLADLLRREVPDMANGVIVPITDNIRVDKEEWARRIEYVLLDPHAAFRRANQLRRALRAKLTWDRAVQEFVGMLDRVRYE